MTTDDVQEGPQPMIMSSSAGTLDENDSHIMSTENGSQIPKPESLLVVTERELSIIQFALTGRALDRIVLPREPATDMERLWVDTELRTRLNPGGRIEVAVENGSQTVLAIDVTPIPQPPVLHYLELDGDYGIRATLVCQSAPGAACRMVHDCRCEEYCACEPQSRLVDSGECNHANWINADDASDEGASGTRILVPVATVWESDHFEWTFIPGSTK